MNGVLRAGKGFVRAQSPELRSGWSLTLRAYAHFVRDKLKIRSLHFVHDRILSNPLLGFKTYPKYKIEETRKGLFYFRAGKGFRTLDIDLGKVALYPLSYSRDVTQI